MTTDFNPERSVLGCYLLRPDYARVGRLEPQHFLAERHRRLFELIRDGIGVDRDTILCALLDGAHEDEVGGIAYVGEHLDYTPAVAGVEYYEQIVIRRYRTHQLGLMAAKVEEARRDGEPVDDILDQTRLELRQLEVQGAELSQTPTRDALDFSEQIDRESRGESSVYLRTGWSAWDDSPEWLGLCSEGVHLVLARSSMGKTSFINSLAVSMADIGYRVALHGTETSAAVRNRAIIFGMAGVDGRKWGAMVRLARASTITDDERQYLDEMRGRLDQAASERAELPLQITGSGVTVERVAADIRRKHARGLDVVFVDYLQNLPQSLAARSEMQAQVMHKSSALAELSAELHIPIVVAAQVSGEKEGKHSIPEVWDCQWASQAHQDAEVVYALDGGHYWAGRLGSAYDPARHGAEDELTVWARKVRDGRIGVKLALAWNGRRRWVGPLWGRMSERGGDER